MTKTKTTKKIEIQDGNKANMFKKVYIPGYMCRRFNFNMCPNQNDASCGAPWNAALTHYRPEIFLSPIFIKIFTHDLLRNLRFLSFLEFSKSVFFSL